MGNKHFGLASIKREGSVSANGENAQDRLDKAKKEIEEILHTYYLELVVCIDPDYEVKLKDIYTEQLRDIKNG